MSSLLPQLPATLFVDADGQPRLVGRVILVTGATGGLGQLVCRTAAAAGATVLLLARQEKRLNLLYDALRDGGAAEPMVVTLDLSAQSDAQFEALAQAVASQLGRLDAVFHAASQFVQLAPLALQTLKDWERAIAVNLLAPFALTRACLPLLRAAPTARAVFCAEAHALAPTAFWGGFAASQAALPGLVRMLAQEHDDHPDLRVHLLIPGAVDTPMRERTHPGETRAQRRPVAELAPLILNLLGAAALPGDTGGTGGTAGAAGTADTAAAAPMIPASGSIVRA